MSRIFISAAHKSSGKTSLSIGIAAALRDAGKQVQTFKKGPDYIDPMWLAMASARPCYNLDFYTMSADEITHQFISQSHSSQISLVEGNKGLYDGLDLDGSNSNAALAKLLNTPVVLVLDTRGMTRGIAPLVQGYQAFDPDIVINGVIFNQVGGSRHESKLRAIIEHYTDVQVIGAVHHDPALAINERHLGLVPSNESGQAREIVNRLAQTVTQQVDMDKLVTVISADSPLSDPVAVTSSDVPNLKVPASDNINIGIFKDSAFGFYYQDDIEAFANAGATLVPINSLQDTALPEIDGLFIGGGFPETHMQALSENTDLLTAVHLAITQGLPSYAECGGLMYLSRSLEWNDKIYKMAGVIPGETKMHLKPQGRGYVRLVANSNHPWKLSSSLESDQNNQQASESAELISAHEFHYSSLENIDPTIKYAYQVKRGTGIIDKQDGLIIHNLLANYSHFRNTQRNQWVLRFVEFIRNYSN
ncbi:Protein similar to cobyrinic acid a,c-diamide synthetase clustered with dissimilatory sulfite reductase [hydrothermal vent metagenome]|uniref:Protein similar to cobyrinic acid a,c-diamide synthetase clustered with dissimilatory sulfite reductase n=1 Tax=hydrothermal vent metagenome TaxID=652676 RepID=A0A3B0Y8N1_9ZZZZ